ncbi:CpaF family protein [bacterium]|nr:MAG: CpaF family protein [bacterium]
MPQPFAAAVRPFIARASRCFVVLEPTLLGVAGARAALEELDAFGVPQSRLSLLVSQRAAERLASAAEIERALGVRVVAEFPPLAERGFARAVAKLKAEIEAIAAEPSLEALRSSSRAPVGDRRQQRRGAEPASNGHASSSEGVARTDAPAAAHGELPARECLKLKIHAALSERIDLVAAGNARGDAAKIAQLRESIGRIAQEVLAGELGARSAEDDARLKQEIVNETLGFGPLEDLMADPDVTEIMVNGYQTIYAERFGVIELTSKRFASDKQFRIVIERIVTPLGRRVDESSPMVDARLSDGSRVNAVIEPIALDGAMLTIRRFGKRLQATDLVQLGSVTQQVLNFLKAAVQARLNVVISGGTGSGKTTFLNVLSNYLPTNERIVTIEDAAELKLMQPHVVRMESRPPNIEGRGEIRARDLVRNALRMRPDRIIVGEARGAEALDMLQAMNTGHDGSLTTIHANSARDALSRIETMVLMAGFDLPVRAIREQVASAVDLVIQVARLHDGCRKVVSISEVVGMEGDIVTMQELVRYRQQGLDLDGKVAGEYQFTGVQPQCLKRFEEVGVAYDVRELSSLKLVESLW